MNKRWVWVFTSGLSLLGIVVVAFTYMKSLRPTWQLLLLAVYAVVHYLLLHRARRRLSWSAAKGVASFLLAAAWMYSSHDKPLTSYHPLTLLTAVLSIFMIAFTLYLALLELGTPFPKRLLRAQAWQTGLGWWAVLSAIPLLGWLPYFLAYFPGKMTYDSFWQWDQAHGITPYNDWHPVLHTWIIQACAWVFNSPASYILLQIAVTCAAVGYAMYVLLRYGMPLWLVVVIDLVYAVNPVNGFFVVTMWKDIPFAAILLVLTVIVFQIVASKGRWLQNLWNLILFIATAFVTMNLRHNGPEAVIASVVVALIALRGVRARLFISLVSMLGLYALFNGPVMTYAHVVKNPLNQALAIPSQQIAATYTYDGKFTPKLRAYFDSILPASHWAADYQPYSVNPIKHDSEYNSAVIQGHLTAYLKNWAGLLVRNPGIFIQSYLNQVAAVWEFHSATGLTPYFDTSASLQSYPLGLQLMAPDKTAKGPFSTVVRQSYEAYVKTLASQFPGVEPKTYAQYYKAAQAAVKPLQSRNLFPGARTLLNKVYWRIQHTWTNYFTKGAIWLFLLVLSLVGTWSRQGFRGVVPYLPAVFLLITVLMAMPATDFRYSFSWIFPVPFLFFAGKLRSLGNEELDNEK